MRDQSVGAGRLLPRLLLLLLPLLGAAEATAVYLWNPGPLLWSLQLAYGIVTARVVFALGRGGGTTPLPRWTAGALLGGTALLSAFFAQVVLQAYPVSGDEYGYNYVADTLMHGRLWNQAYALPVRDVLQTFYIGGHGDQRVSQYLPGWPAVLIPFKWLGVPQAANPVVGLIAGILLHLALGRVDAPRRIRLGALALGIAAPFTILNDASFFSHSLTAAALLAIVWLDLRDPARPTRWNRFGIGLAFSVLLCTRYETFLLSFALFAADGLWRRRFGFVGWALPAAAGALPITLLLLAYNWRITGSPFTTTFQWVSPEIGFGLHSTGGDGPHSLWRGLAHTAIWFASWQDFAAAILLPLYGVALWRRVVAGTVRWFDLLWPVVVVFFVFFPDAGGFQYGPRYWYIGFVAMPVTIAAGLPVAGENWRIWQWRLDPVRLAACQCAAFAGFLLGYAAFLYLRTESQLTPYRLAGAAPTPALVLMRNFGHRYVAWQGYSQTMLAKDYTRNGVGALGPLAIALDLGDDRTARLCKQMPGRAIYRIELDRIGPHGSLVPVCNGATPLNERP